MNIIFSTVCPSRYKLFITRTDASGTCPLYNSISSGKEVAPDPTHNQQQLLLYGSDSNTAGVKIWQLLV
jgi:hypothetical protein